MPLPIPSPLPLPNLSKPQSGWEVNLNGDVFLNELDPCKWTQEMLQAIGLSKQVVIKCVHVPQWTFQALIENEDRWLWVDSDRVTLFHLELSGSSAYAVSKGSMANWHSTESTQSNHFSTEMRERSEAPTRIVWTPMPAHFQG